MEMLNRLDIGLEFIALCASIIYLCIMNFRGRFINVISGVCAFIAAFYGMRIFFMSANQISSKHILDQADFKNKIIEYAILLTMCLVINVLAWYYRKPKIS